MAIQDVIDRHLSDEGKNLRSIVVISEEGDAEITSNVYVHFRKCKIGDLSVSGSSVVVIEESEISGDVTVDPNCSVTMDRTTITGSEINITDSKITQKKCTISAKTSLSGSSLDAYANDRDTAEISLELKDGSKAEIREDTFDNVGTIVSVSGGSSAVIRKLDAMATKKSFVATDHSKIEVYAGAVGTSGAESLVEASDYSKVLLAKVGMPEINVSGQIILAESNSTVDIFDLPRAVSDSNGLVCNDGATINVVGFSDLESQQHTLKVENGKLSLRSSTGYIHSINGNAIRMDGGEIEIDTVGDIYSDVIATVFLNDDSKLRMKNIGEILNEKDRAVDARNNVTLEITGCPYVFSESMDAIFIGSNAVLKLKSVALVEGFTLAGIYMGDDCRIDISSCTEIKGHEGAGLVTGSRCIVTITDVDKIDGGGRGIRMDGGCHLRMNNVGAIEGMDFGGISVGSGSTIEAIGIGLVTSKNGPCFNLDSNTSLKLSDFGVVEISDQGIPYAREKGVIYGGSNCSVTLEDGNEVYVKNGGGTVAGIDLGSGGKIIARGLTRIHGSDASGIRVDSGYVEVTGVGIVSGNAGVTLTGGSRGVFSGVDSYGGGDYGVRAIDGSIAEVMGGTLSGGLGAAVAENGGKIIVTGASLQGLAISVSDGLVEASGCSCNGDVSVTDGVSNLDSCAITGNVEVNPGSVSLKNCSISGNAVLTNAAVEALLTTCSQWTITTSSLLLLGCSGTLDYVSGVCIRADNDGTFVTTADTTDIKNLTSFDTTYMV